MAAKRNHDRTGMPIGAPPIPFDQDVATAICSLIITGSSLNSILKRHGPSGTVPTERWCPDYTVIARWRREVPAFALEYERARLDRTDYHAEEMLDISDDTSNDYMEKQGKNGESYDSFNGEAVARSKLRVDTRKWVAGRLNPKVYGEKTTTELTGPNGGPLQTEQTVTYALPSNGRDDAQAGNPEPAPGDEADGA
jgi:hypothetical protein